MGSRFQIVFDAANPARVAEFWRTALHYVAEPPPDGYANWPDFAERNNIPREAWSDSAVDPTGVGPRLFFQPVPEAKTVKNRVHLDISAATGLGNDERGPAVDREVDRLIGAGATVVSRVDSGAEYFAVMQDPEGNEFCVQ